MALLKRDYGISHGSAHRLSLVARARADGRPTATPVTITHALYPGNKAALVPIRNAYLRSSRRVETKMIKPGTMEVNLGLSLGDVATGERLESAATFNALFSHRVRLRAADEVAQELTEWLRLAYERAA